MLTALRQSIKQRQGNLAGKLAPLEVGVKQRLGLFFVVGTQQIRRPQPGVGTCIMQELAQKRPPLLIAKLV